MRPPDERRDPVSRMASELKDDPTPELDWDRVEASLLEQIGKRATAPVRAARAWPRWALAAAAGVLALLGARELMRQLPVAHLESSARRWGGDGRVTIDGSRLGVGDHVTSGSAEVRVVHAGRAAWTLAPNSRGTVAFGGDLLTVQLERGSAFAEVVPSQRKESFAIEADALRAAAHGTVFRVSRRGDHAEVEVTEGVVAVGPSSTRGDTRGWLLAAPAKGQFALDGVSGEVAKTPASPGGAATAVAGGAPATQPAPASGVPAPSETAATSEPVELPEKPTMDAVQSVFARLIPLVNQCFEQHTQARGDMQVTASTRVTLRVAPDGTITGRDFVPPLAPAVLACSAPHVDAMRFAPSKQGITVTRYIQLEMSK
jgi:ferric-dicitrate binding protein FerR (iron transport regulator)